MSWRCDICGATFKLDDIPETKTMIMLNLGNPDQAFEKSFIPNQGIGLAREEFIINSYIKIHPKALINYYELKDKSLKKQIDDLTSVMITRQTFSLTN